MGGDISFDVPTRSAQARHHSGHRPLRRQIDTRTTHALFPRMARAPLGVANSAAPPPAPPRRGTTFVGIVRGRRRVPVTHAPAGPAQRAYKGSWTYRKQHVCTHTPFETNTPLRPPLRPPLPHLTGHVIPSFPASSAAIPGAVSSSADDMGSRPALTSHVRASAGLRSA